MNSREFSLTVRSYAKVNLSLDILEKRPDGFHSLRSVMQTISLYDTITVRTGGEGIRVSCTVPSIPIDERNLVWKAASAIMERHSGLSGLDIHIEKRIPVEAGLGGGSSNAAAVLRGLNTLLGLSSAPAELCELAAGIGSDVPFFLTGGTALVLGRGEEVRPLPDVRPWWMLVVKPPFGVSTSWAYRQLDELRSGQNAERPVYSDRMIECIAAENCVHLPELLGNDLESPAFQQHPEIERIKSRMLETGAAGALMCGSGSAVFGLFEDENHAYGAVDALSDMAAGLFVSRMITRTEALELD